MLKSLSQFAARSDGNIAMMFALLLFPFLTIAGISVDFFINQRAQTAVSEGADAALLAAARAHITDRGRSDSELAAIAWRVFNANVPEASRYGITENNFRLIIPRTQGQDFGVSIQGANKTSLLSVFGRDSLPISVEARARVGQPRTLEVSLVLDNTFSMQGSRIAALKSAASGLVNTLMDDPTNGVRIALVPFSQYVNVGENNRQAPWLDVPQDRTESVTENICRRNNQNIRRRDCTPVTRTCTRERDGVLESFECEELICPDVEGEIEEICADETTTTELVWTGCVGSRNYPFNVQDRQYSARRVPGLNEVTCPQPILPLSGNRTSVLAAISGMAIEGSDTYAPTGFVWGYRTLSPGEPFDEGVSYEQIEADGGQKVMIVMSDGENTVSATFPRHDDRDRGVGADRIFLETCDEAKSNNIEIYTIAFEVTNGSVRDLLRQCASSEAQFFDAENADALDDTFAEIADSLVQLALTQ